MKFDMNRAWSQATAMVSANWQYLALIAGIFFLLPNLLMVVAFPDMMGMLLNPAGDPEQLAAQIQTQLIPLFAMIVVVMLLSIVGYAAMVSLLGPNRPTVGEALRATMRALPTLLGMVAVSLVGYVVLGLAAGLVMVLVVLALSFVIGEIAATMLAVIVFLVVLLWLAMRFILVTPAVMLDGERNPVRAFVRSWKLTGPHHSRIFGFFILLMVAYAVISMVVSMVTGLIGNLFVIGLVSGLLGAAVGMVLTAVIVAIHSQASGDGPATAQTFD